MQSEIPVAPLFVFIYFYTHKVGIRAVINQEDFIRRLQQREKEAFQELFYSWHRPLCFFASRIIKDQDVAEDLVQDVFVAFWKYDLSAFPNEKTIRTFLYTSVRNGCLNYLRDLEIRARNDRKAVPESEEDQDCFLLRQMESEVVTELFEAIDELPERCREIFYYGLSSGKRRKTNRRTPAGFCQYGQDAKTTGQGLSERTVGRTFRLYDSVFFRILIFFIPLVTYFLIGCV